jgi:quercetin dioxygenase-like cupin family protein
MSTVDTGTNTSNSGRHVLVRASDAEVLASRPGTFTTLLAESGGTGGALTVNRATFRQGVEGTPAHYHTKMSETLFVISGALQVLAADEVLVLEEGDMFIAPPLMWHAWAPAPGSDADALVVFTPGLDRFDYYRLLDRVNRSEADPAEIQASQERFDNHYVDSPAWQAARAAAEDAANAPG